MRAVVPPAPIPLSANQGTQYSLEGEDGEIEDEDGGAGSGSQGSSEGLSQ